MPETCYSKTTYIRILKPGNYLIGHLEFCGDFCCSDMIWESEYCHLDQEIEENLIDTSCMDKDEFETFEE